MTWLGCKGAIRVRFLQAGSLRRGIFKEELVCWRAGGCGGGAAIIGIKRRRGPQWSVVEEERRG